MSVGRFFSHGTRGRSSADVDRLTETELQSSIFRESKSATAGAVDFASLERALKHDSQIPAAVVDKVLHHVRDHLADLGIDQPGNSLVLHWVVGLLREQGFSLGEIPLQSIELSLGDVELDIYHPVGLNAGIDKNPQATSQRIARRIKAQFAERRVFQEEVMQAHSDGRLHILHLGAVDRPHDVFLTPDYLKLYGLPVTSGAPAAGPAKRPDVLLSHMIRFTHELRNHFAGDIQWGYVNTLLLPYLVGMGEADLRQFAQQLLFEFAQLDVERGGLDRRVILDFDFELPKPLASLPATGPGGLQMDRTYADLSETMTRFNDAILDVLRAGDFRQNPFQSPHLVFHLNEPDRPWSGQHQDLMEIAFQYGNPSLAFSYRRRHLGALGRVSLNDPDFLKTMQTPAALRGFSTNSVGLNLARLCFEGESEQFASGLDEVLDLAVTSHRQKRLFISRLMAYGNRGPLQFLRHKAPDGQPFLKLAWASQPMHLIGLGEAAAYCNGSPFTSPDGLVAEAQRLLELLSGAIEVRNRIHKLHMILMGTKHESLAYRFAALDLRKLGQGISPYLLRRADQAQPIYTEGANILAFTNLPWRDRIKIEARLHTHFTGHHQHTLFIRNGVPDDVTLVQKVFRESQGSGLDQLRIAPDMRICLSCYAVFGWVNGDVCPTCKSTLVTPYGFCQAGFSPVNGWCLGKRSEWKIRPRIDDYQIPVQEQFPF